MRYCEACEKDTNIKYKFSQFESTAYERKFIFRTNNDLTVKKICISSCKQKQIR